MSGLKPPQINTQDPGAKDLESESSDDHFSSASEGSHDSNRLSTDDAPQSPIPTTRVERVDDSAAHGEVPGTDAYNLRTQDAVPDEIEIVPEGRRSRSATASRSRSGSHLSVESRPRTPSGSPVPKTVVDKVDDRPSHGEVDGTLAKEQRMADAEPDEIRQASPVAVDGSGHGFDQSASRGQDLDDDPEDRQAWFRSMWEGNTRQGEQIATRDELPNDTDNDNQDNEDDKNDDNEDNDDDFGDDFVEGGDGDDDDFGDFDEADDPPTAAAAPDTSVVASSPSILASLPPLDLKPGLTSSELHDTIGPYLDAIFPKATPSPHPRQETTTTSSTSPFLSDRSLSLWQQLVSPPPMQPPNWTRSRIRRLFLVSLGVPVDLDEILPPSKQKRLLLPNINLPPNNNLDRLKQADINDSTTSLDSKTGVPKRPKRQTAMKGPPPPPDFDANAATLLCRTTVAAMAGLPDDELREHVAELEGCNQRASGVLEYWLHRKDDALKEKEALEGVIENLVGFVKGRRAGGGR